LTVAAQDRGLLLVGPQQDDDGAFASALMLPPIGTQRGAPHRDGREEPVLASAAAGQQDQPTYLAPHFARRLEAGTIPEEIDLALLGERQAVDQLRNDAPRPKAGAAERAAEQLRVRQRLRERDRRGHSALS
jgi:hypothetical protein